MLKAILHFYKQALVAIENGMETDQLFAMNVWDDIARASYVEEEDIAKIAAIRDKIDEQINAISIA